MKKYDLAVSNANMRLFSQDALDEKLLEILRINGEVELQKDYYHRFCFTIPQKGKSIFTPEYDLGIKSLRLLGLVRLVTGLILPVMLFLLTIGGNWLDDTFDLAPANPEPEDIDCFLGCLLFIPWMLS